MTTKHTNDLPALNIGYSIGVLMNIYIPSNPFLAAIECPPVPHVDNAVASSIQHTSSTEVTYTCEQGLRFSDGLPWTTIVCLSDGSWSSIPGSCEREYNRFEPLRITFVFMEICLICFDRMSK